MHRRAVGPRGENGRRGDGGWRWRQSDLVLLAELDRLGIVRCGAEGLLQVLGSGRISGLAEQVSRETQRGHVVWGYLKCSLRFLESLFVLALFRVDAREQYAWIRELRVCLRALLANDHRLHEAPHRQVRFGKRAVRLGVRVGRESVLKLRKLGRTQGDFRGAWRHGLQGRAGTRLLLHPGMGVSNDKEGLLSRRLFVAERK